MRMDAKTLIVALATFIPCVAHPADTFTGSGVVVGTRGEILTNSHVVESCERIIVRLPSKELQAAALVARDKKNDLAVVRINNLSLSVAAFRAGGAVRAGDAVVALGYPLSGLLATTANLTVGNVSALAGLGDDSRYLQISAPVQPGNSGGPLLDASAHLVGIVTSKLNAAGVALVTGDIPQNVNFALKAEVARTFLESKGIAYQTVRSDQQLSPADVGDMARPFTVYIECHQAAARSAAVPKAPSRPEPSASNEVAEDVAEMISQYRHEHGLSTVKTDLQLTALAEQQARAMAASGIMDHSVAGPFASRVAGLHTGEAAENIAAGTKTWSETLRLWKDSPGHNANLLQSQADSVGIAMARNDQTRYKTYWAMVIADRSPRKKDRKAPTGSIGISENPITSVENFVCKYLC
jgi:uncharacterized protein YkwD